MHGKPTRLNQRALGTTGLGLATFEGTPTSGNMYVSQLSQRQITTPQGDSRRRLHQAQPGSRHI
jgi:hypothetical protein